MLEKVRKFIREQNMLQAGDGVIAALSGGADSVCLLSVLKELAVSGGWQVRALHVHHGLRGEEADHDEQFVRDLCAGWKIPLQAVHYDVAAYAQEHRLSEEEAGRLLRYETLEAAADEWEKCGLRVRIAVAHHADDQAETILHHLIRGSGLRGLSGMAPVCGRRIRPFLCVGRKDILDYLNNKGQVWCEDSTNACEDYTRNRIRSRLIPLMREEVNPRAAENIVRAGALFAQTDAYMTDQAEKFMEKDGSVRLQVFLEQPQIMRSYLVRQMLDRCACGQKDLTAKHFAQIMALAEHAVGARCDLPGGYFAERTYDRLRLRQKEAGTAGEGKTRGNARRGTPVRWDSQHPCPAAGGLKFCDFSYENGMKIPKNQYTKWFDYDKIKDTLSVRTRRTGDFITLAGGGQKAVSRFMIDEKIPKEDRDRVLLLAEGSHVLWVVGYRISEYYKITAQTKRVLQVSCIDHIT